MSNFAEVSSQKLTALLAGKTIKECKIDDEGMDSFLVFSFDDGAELRIRYDWLYEFEVKHDGVLVERFGDD